MTTASPEPALVVTGATGRLGGRVARRLAERGVPQRLLVRSPGRAPELPGATVAAADFGDREAVVRGLTGAETVLMVSASESADRLALHRIFVDAAAEAGVRHLVYISFCGAAPDATFTLARDHFHTEEHIGRGGWRTPSCGTTCTPTSSRTSSGRTASSAARPDRAAPPSSPRTTSPTPR
ncbi:NAD(P)H-binding protein [Streptomyces antibioticus]